MPAKRAKAKPKKASATPVMKVVNLSDLHIGSSVGLWPTDFTSEEGFPIGQTEFQKWLWECWSQVPDFIREHIKPGEPWAIVFNGDLVEGIHHKNIQIMSANHGDQVAAVKQTLKPLLEATGTPPQIFVVKGTECHTRNDELAIGRMLDAWVDETNGQSAFDFLPLQIHGCNTFFRHHIGTSARPYLEASMLSIHLGVERQEAVRSGTPVPKVIVRAHRHRHGMFSDGVGMCLVTGAWQGLTRYGNKVVPGAQCMPSVLILDWSDRPYDSLPDVHERVWTPKPRKMIAL